MKVIVLKEKDIKEIFTMKDAIQASKDALEIYSKGGSDIPLRTNIDVEKENGRSLYMPGYVENIGALGVKLVSTYPKNVEKGLSTISSIMILENEKTGEVSSIIDGNYLTKLRTGAVSGAATEMFSRKDASVFALIGTGGQARTQLEAVLNVRNIKEVRISGRDKEKSQRFVDRMINEFGDRFGCNIFVAENSDDAVKGSDIITTVTTATKPVFDGKLIKKGAHINGVGSFTPEMQELDSYVLYNANKIYLDTRDGVLNESGDFIIPMKSNKLSLNDITGELGEAIIGKVSGRENNDEITILKTVGSGILDLVTAKRIYERAVDRGIGDIIEF